MQATLVGVVAILLCSALALLTAATAGVPPFELLALSFAIAFAASLVLLSALLPGGGLRARHVGVLC